MKTPDEITEAIAILTDSLESLETLETERLHATARCVIAALFWAIDEPSGQSIDQLLTSLKGGDMPKPKTMLRFMRKYPFAFGE